MKWTVSQHVPGLTANVGPSLQDQNEARGIIHSDFWDTILDGFFYYYFFPLSFFWLEHEWVEVSKVRSESTAYVTRRERVSLFLFYLFIQNYPYNRIGMRLKVTANLMRNLWEKKNSRNESIFDWNP